MEHVKHSADGLERSPVNFVPLTPISFLRRTAEVYPERTAIVYGERRTSWRAMLDRSHRLASALVAAGVRTGDTVAVMAANTPEMLEMHFGVPMSGAMLNTLNVRLDAAAIAFMLRHGDAKVLVTDTEYADVVEAALALLDDKPLVIDIIDPAVEGGHRLAEIEYEGFLAGGDPHWEGGEPADEWQAIALNYTSGTTGNPKGVVYHHRGAYLAALSNMLDWAMPRHAVFLWTLPLFHCNAGASPGRWRPTPVPASACGGWMLPPCSMRFASTRSLTTAGRRSCMRCLPTHLKRGRRASTIRSTDSLAARRRRCR